MFSPQKKIDIYIRQTTSYSAITSLLPSASLRECNGTAILGQTPINLLLYYLVHPLSSCQPVRLLATSPRISPRPQLIRQWQRKCGCYTGKTPVCSGTISALAGRSASRTQDDKHMCLRPFVVVGSFSHLARVSERGPSHFENSMNSCSVAQARV